MALRSLHPVILCGGAGARLWPASTSAMPKPFLALTGEKSLLQETALRLAGVPGARPPIVIASASHADLVARAACARSASSHVSDYRAWRPRRPRRPGRGGGRWRSRRGIQDGVMPWWPPPITMCPTLAPSPPGWRPPWLAPTESGSLVTFGIRPTAPSSAYGYILPGAALAGEAQESARFIEKPDAARAAELIAAGWLWNSGNFLFRADAVLGELDSREPGLMDAVRRARDGGTRTDGMLALGAAFLEAPSLAIDVAVMERTERGAVLGVDYAWSDLGAWDAILAAAPRDGAGNAVDGRAVVQDSEGCLIRGDAQARIVAVGLKNIAVVVEGGRVLVCDLAAAQAIRPGVAAIEEP